MWPLFIRMFKKVVFVRIVLKLDRTEQKKFFNLPKILEIVAFKTLHKIIATTTI